MNNEKTETVKAVGHELQVINFLPEFNKCMSKMTLEELLTYEKYLTQQTNNDNADDMLEILGELDIYKRNLRQKHL